MNATPEIRVLHVIEAMGRGGAESLIVELTRGAGPGVRVHVCALNQEGPALEAAALAGARIVRLDRSRGIGPPARVRALARAIREHRIDVIHGHNPTGGLYAGLAGSAAGRRAIVRTEHSLHYTGRYMALYPVIEPILTLWTRRVVCVCRAVLESHARRLPWAARRFVTVANGISPAPHPRPRRETRLRLGLEPDAEVVLTVGSLTPQKAQHVLLEAFALCHAQRAQSRLLIAGDGPLRGALERRTRDLGVDAAVRFLGARDDVADLIEACDVFALSSIREGLPVTLLEAMRGGRPAVVTRVGGMPEALVEAVTGHVVEPGDARAMAAAFGALVGHEVAAERMVAETEALYREVLGRAVATRFEGAEADRAAR
jgi:glycosyltransferase involved in cell wall biosynthesis